MGVVPTRMMPMGAWRKSAPPLPYDAEVEYLQAQRETGNISNSNPAAYIDTGIVPGPGTGFEVKACGLSSPTGVAGEVRNGVDQTLNGTRTYFGFQLNQAATSSVQAFGSTVNGYYKSTAIQTCSFDYATRTLKIVRSDGDTRTGTVSGSDISYSNNFMLFCRWQNTDRNNPQNNGMRLYYCKIWQNGVLVRNLWPVRVGTEGCLYDSANPNGGDNGDGLYHTKGNGAFSYGPDK